MKGGSIMGVLHPLPSIRVRGRGPYTQGGAPLPFSPAPPSAPPTPQIYSGLPFSSPGHRVAPSSPSLFPSLSFTHSLSPPPAPPPSWLPASNAPGTGGRGGGEREREGGREGGRSAARVT